MFNRWTMYSPYMNMCPNKPWLHGSIYQTALKLMVSGGGALGINLLVMKLLRTASLSLLNPGSAQRRGGSACDEREASEATPHELHASIVYINMDKNMCIYIYIRVYMYVYTYIYIYVCVYVYVCIHTHAHVCLCGAMYL